MATQQAIADRLRISKRQVARHQSQGLYGKGATLDEAIDGYMDWLKDRSAENPDVNNHGEEYQKGRAREINERADNIALKNARLRKELCPVDVATFVLSRLAAQIGSVLDGIPGDLKRKVPKLNASELEIVKRRLIHAQNACANIPVYLDEMLDDFIRTASES